MSVSNEFFFLFRPFWLLSLLFLGLLCADRFFVHWPLFFQPHPSMNHLLLLYYYCLPLLFRSSLLFSLSHQPSFIQPPKACRPAACPCCCNLASFLTPPHSLTHSPINIKIHIPTTHNTTSYSPLGVTYSRCTNDIFLRSSHHLIQCPEFMSG